MQRSFLQLLLIGMIASALTLMVSGTWHQTTDATPTKSALDRILAKGELRCGYALWPGLVERDANTGKFSGAFYDYMEALGRQLELKIVWAEEVGFGDIPVALNTGRIDAMCSGTWTNPLRGKFVDFVTPVAYQAIQPYVRGNEHRFDNQPDGFNHPNVKISVVDGESAETIAREDFPQATLLAMPKGTEGAQMLLNVLTGKADVAFLDAETAGRIIAAYPGQLRAVQNHFPLRVFGVPIAIRKGETGLKETLDNATRQLLMTGVIDRILSRYQNFPGTFLSAQLPFVPAN